MERRLLGYAQLSYSHLVCELKMQQKTRLNGTGFKINNYVTCKRKAYLISNIFCVCLKSFHRSKYQKLRLKHSMYKHNIHHGSVC